MVILLAGASHTGKTLLAQKILEKRHIPYLSIDHLKMGLIRSGRTALTPQDDDKLTAYLWPIVKEIVKTAVENGQNLTIEGVYIPFDWQKDFDGKYLKHIRYYCLVMTQDYIKMHFSEIKKHADVVEKRLDDSGCSLQSILKENAENQKMCGLHSLPCILIEREYAADMTKELARLAETLDE